MLRHLLADPAGGDLVPAIGGRFTSTTDLESFDESQGITGASWSRTSH